MSDSGVAEIIDAETSIRIITAMAEAVTRQQAYLSGLDSTVGDGDHGVNLAKALQEAARRVQPLANAAPDIVWRTTGKVIQESVGGASGLLFGAFFVGGSRTIKDRDTLTTADVAAMMGAGLENIQKRGKAQPGDKTMVDALAPAAAAAAAAVEADLSLVEALDQMAFAAQTGADATREMVARHGRAKFLGERSRGYQDAGATSIAVMLAAWAEAMRESK